MLRSQGFYLMCWQLVGKITRNEQNISVTPCISSSVPHLSPVVGKHRRDSFFNIDSLFLIWTTRKCKHVVCALLWRVSFADRTILRFTFTIYFFITEYYSIVWIFHNVFIYFLIDGLLGSLQFWTILNTSAMNISVQVFLWTEIFISLG